MISTWIEAFAFTANFLRLDVPRQHDGSRAQVLVEEGVVCVQRTAADAGGDGQSRQLPPDLAQKPNVVQDHRVQAPVRQFGQLLQQLLALLRLGYDVCRKLYLFPEGVS
jgi:hypothetical protein